MPPALARGVADVFRTTQYDVLFHSLRPLQEGDLLLEGHRVLRFLIELDAQTLQVLQLRRRIRKPQKSCEIILSHLRKRVNAHPRYTLSPPIGVLSTDASIRPIIDHLVCGLAM